ncbi:MAG TPA: hypothetical protein PLQ11_09725 [Beijerinckiaceae bacterium]|nr:hypothetical protein [Beijerinckiaceae bacterium]
MSAGCAASLGLAEVEALRRLARQFEAGSDAAKLAELERCASLPILAPEVLVAWHDVLLFMLAYPQTPALRARCESELSRCAELARVLAGTGEDLPDALHGSGLAWTRVAVTFNHQVARWLADTFPGVAGFHAARGSADTLRKLLRESLPDAEFEALAEPAEDAGALIENLGALAALAAADPLRWLLDNLDASGLPDRMLRSLYDDLDVFVGLRSQDSLLTRARLRGLDRPIAYQDRPLARSEDARALLDEPLAPAIDLTDDDRARLLTTARGLLALLGRQTEPISSCNGTGVMAYDLGRGVVIALFSTAPADRTPLDSHVGMMLFKNGLPVAYGGGWPFLGVCKIGINIFEPYRGGESHFLFLSVMRAYRHLFGIRRFIVERYQFGRNNPEGIASAAYWFYYRLGFRSMRTDLASLAEREWARLRDGKVKATTRRTLERFTEAHMEMRLPGCPDSFDYCDPADLSRTVTAVVKRRFAGDRKAFSAWAETQLRAILDFPAGLSPQQRRALALLAPVVALIPGLAQWSAGERTQVRDWILSRTGEDERPYFALLTGHPRLQAALEALPQLDDGEALS